MVKSAEAAPTQSLPVPWYSSKRAAWSWAVFFPSALPEAARLDLLISQNWPKLAKNRYGSRSSEFSKYTAAFACLASKC